MLSNKRKGYNTRMRWLRRGLVCLGLTVSILSMPQLVLAQPIDFIATNSAEATEAAVTATPAAQLFVEKAAAKKQDITETQGPTVGKLGQYVLSRSQTPLGV